MSKMVEINKRKSIDLSMGANKADLAIDNINDVMVTSPPPTGAGVRISNCNSLNLVKSLIQIMYERGEINSKTNFQFHFFKPSSVHCTLKIISMYLLI